MENEATEDYVVLHKWAHPEPQAEGLDESPEGGFAEEGSEDDCDYLEEDMILNPDEYVSVSCGRERRWSLPLEASHRCRTLLRQASSSR